MSSILKGITINESLQDDFIDLMKSKGYNVKPRGSIEQQKAERDAMLAQRKKDAENRTAPPTPSAEEITNAKEKLAQLERVFDKNYQYSDDHSVYSKNQDIAQQISSLRQLIARGEQGVAEEVNPEVTSDDYTEPSQNVRMGDFVFNARTFTGALGSPNAKGLQIRAYDPKNLKSSIGSADFIVKKDKKGNQWLESDDTEVNDEYRSKGVATMMYAFAKSLGNDIKDSPYQSTAGKNMWKKWGSDAKHLVGEQGVAEGSTGLSIQQLATISDEALDNAYHYGRSQPENTFGWQANLKSAAYAKQMIDKGVTDIEAISDAIHKGWNVTAQAFVKNPDQFSDTEKLKAAGKLEAKLQQRAQLMKQNYAQLPEEEKEKDRVVARALLRAITGQQGVAEGKGKRCMQCGMINCKCPGDSCKCKPIKGWVPGKGFKKDVDEAANAAQQAAIAINMKKHHQKPKNEDMDEGILGFLTKKPQSKLVRRDDYADRLEIARRQRGLSNPYFKILLDKFNAGGKLTDNEKRDLGRWLATQPRNFRAKQELDKYLEVSEATSNELVDLESAYRRATEITKQIKYDDTVTQIIVQIQMLAEKSGIPEENLRYEIDQVYEAKSQLESAIYGLDEVFQDAMRQQQYDQEDNDVDESQIFAGGGMGQSYRKFTPKSAGTMNEMPDTSGPVGTQPGGRRVYRPKSAGTNMKRESSILKGLRETGSTGTSAGSAGIGGGAMVGGPTTYEQEFDPFKRKGARRITAMTNEGKK